MSLRVSAASEYTTRTVGPGTGERNLPLAVVGSGSNPGSEVASPDPGPN